MPEPEGFAWQSLGKLARLESGHTPRRAEPAYWDGDIPWIGIRDATSNHGNVISDTAQHITEAGLENSSARLLPAGTVCLSRTASVGYVVQTAVPMATSQDFVNWVCGPDLLPDYLRYILMLEQDSIRRFSYGTTHQTMYYPDAKALHVLIPSLADQKAIAEVLGALDDKIATNAKLAKTSVALADAEFGNARAQAVLYGTTFGQTVNVGGGATPSTKVSEFWGGSVQWATPTDVTGLAVPYIDSTARTLTDDGLASCSSRLYAPGSILMTSRATIGAFAIARSPMAVNQGFIVANAVDVKHQWWLFHEMRTRVDDFIAHANGATFLELSKSKFKALRLEIPDATTASAFGDQVAPKHELAYAIARESNRLAALRDALLPELMSGRLRVKDAERAVEEAV